MLVQLVQEELDEIRNLVEDKLDKQRSLVEDEIQVYKTNQKKMLSLERVIQYYPTPSLSLLALMLIASIYNIKSKNLKAGTEQIPRTKGQKAVFLARSRLGVVGKVNNKVISKAQLKRLLRKPLALYKRDLLSPPSKYLDLEKHLIGHLFKQAELVHLESYKIMNSQLEISLRDLKVKGYKVLDYK